MSATFSNFAVNKVAVWYLNSALSQLRFLRLFTSNFTPVPTTAVGAFAECALPGYTPLDYSLQPWSISVNNGIALGSQPLKTWTFGPYAGPPVRIYGYYATDVSGNLWHYAERWSQPVTVLAGGQALALRPIVRVLRCG